MVFEGEYLKDLFFFRGEDGVLVICIDLGFFVYFCFILVIRGRAHKGIVVLGIFLSRVSH